MLAKIKFTIKYFCGPPAAKIAGLWPTRTTLYFARQLNGIQLTVSEMYEIATAVRSRPT